MNPKILLRIAATLVILHSVGHTFGFLTWKDHVDATYDEVVKQMTAYKFPFMGATHSLAEFYTGIGFSITLSLLLCAWFLLMAANLSNDDHRSIATRMLLPLVLFLVGLGIFEIIFFFPLAYGLSLAAALLTLIAMFRLMKAD